MSSNPKAKILIIEDDPNLLYGLNYQFSQSNFSVKTTSDPQTVFDILKEWSPSVILLDILLPGKDGFQLLSEIKNNQEFSSIPVIIISNLDQTKDQIIASKLGASAFFVKSNISLDKLVKEVTQFIH